MGLGIPSALQLNCTASIRGTIWSVGCSVIRGGADCDEEDDDDEDDADDDSDVFTNKIEKKKEKDLNIIYNILGKKFMS